MKDPVAVAPACIKKIFKELFFTSASALDAFAAALDLILLLPPFVVCGVRVRGKSWVGG